MSALIALGVNETFLARYEAKIDKSGGPDACWPWSGATWKGGYGQISSGGKRGKRLRAHRVAYQLEHGPIPDNVDVLHKCDNPPCCNPNHLLIGTQLENMQDMARKGRSGPKNHPERMARGDKHPLRKRPELAARGERQGLAKLTEELVREIRASKLTHRELARRLNVDRRTISFVRRGQTWRHVT